MWREVAEEETVAMVTGTGSTAFKRTTTSLTTPLTPLLLTCTTSYPSPTWVSRPLPTCTIWGPATTPNTRTNTPTTSIPRLTTLTPTLTHTT